MLKKIEVILLEILPEAFAVVKETARRFTENTELHVTATQHDRDLAVRKKTLPLKMMWPHGKILGMLLDLK